MSGRRERPQVKIAAPAAASAPIRLDRLVNPYGASPLVAESLAAADDLHRDPDRLLPVLHRRLAAQSGVPAGWVRPANGIDEVINAAIAGAGEGPLVVFPPGNDPAGEQPSAGRERIDVWRSQAFLPALDPETAAELPRDGIAVLTSPHDPSGALLPVQDAVRLARSCKWVFIDERCGGFGPRSFSRLAREFDNVVVFQTLETWAGLSAFPVGWAVGSPRALDRIFADSVRPVSAGAAVAALATLDDMPGVLANVRRVRDERSRLFRMLRKLNMVQPMPSWAGFVLARATRSTGDELAEQLRQRGILVLRPSGPALEDVLRISAGRPSDTDALQRALVEAGLVI